MEFFDDDAGKRIGTASLQSPSIAAYEANAAEVLANTALATAFAGYAERLFENETLLLSAQVPRPVRGRLLRHLHQKDRPDLVLPGRRDQGRR